MFELNDFNCMTFRHELCAATRDRDDARVRLFIVVEPRDNKLRYEVHCNDIITRRKYFQAALSVFNILIGSIG